MRLLLIFLFLTSVANAETLLHCKFKWGDKVSPGKRTTYTEGEIKDIYLKIDFDKEKVDDDNIEFSSPRFGIIRVEKI